MKAMILAAGLGTRLGFLTADCPKALVEIDGHTLLEITLSRLRRFGVSEVIINVHHFARMIVDYLEVNHQFGMHIEVSCEDELLDTGGGLKKASHFFYSAKDFARREEPFIVHNVDVLSTIDLGRMLQFHTENRALATLAVQNRKTSRYLLFDDQLQLCGRQSGNHQEPELVRQAAKPKVFAFSGIHVISPRLLAMLSEKGAFSIITSYMRLAAQQERILAFPADEYYWRDLGSPQNLAQAAHDLKEKVISQ
ncbi:MAG: nucleotidyltransferase family protein [Terriglobales bacterium]